MIKYNTFLQEFLVFSPFKNKIFNFLFFIIISYLSFKSYHYLLDIDNTIWCKDRDDVPQHNNNNNWWYKPIDWHVRAPPVDIARGFNIVNNRIDGILTVGIGTLALRVAGLTNASLPIKAAVFGGVYITISVGRGIYSMIVNNNNQRPNIEAEFYINEGVGNIKFTMRKM